MIPSLLKKIHLGAHPDSLFFEPETMKFWGDTMKNFSVRVVTVETTNRELVQCWELSRRNPVKWGHQSPHFFSFDGSIKHNVRRVIEKPATARY